MTAAISIVQQDVFTALRSLILGLITCEVVQGLGNGVPMPLGPFIAMTPLYQNRLSTNVDTYADPVTTIGTKTMYQSTQCTIQIDCFGPQSGDWASILSTVLRDEYACTAMAPNVQPLHDGDPHQSALVDGEEQYEQRWTLTAVLQYNPIVSVPQDFAASLYVKPVNVDITFKP